MRGYQYNNYNSFGRGGRGGFHRIGGGWRQYAMRCQCAYHNYVERDCCDSGRHCGEQRYAQTRDCPSEPPRCVSGCGHGGRFEHQGHPETGNACHETSNLGHCGLHACSH
ncbi:uncharacterized protein [Drosophila takahashii]|uniref:uncharacterized protein n=1 Tax=Drosophila takahashii TaxID=29030 RepID=UPI003898EDCC